jgi:hypothetical protein
MTFGYDGNIQNWQDWRGKVTKNRIRNHACNLLHATASNREDDDKAGWLFTT